MKANEKSCGSLKSATSKRRMKASDLLNSGLVGIWSNRKGIKDSRAFSRQLRRRAQNRS